MNYTYYSAATFISAALFSTLIALPAQGQTVVTTIPITGGSAIALNPVTNKIYVLGFDYFGNGGTGNQVVTVIDGASNSITAAVDAGPAGSTPFQMSLAVNPVTNKIYVTNSNSTTSLNNSITVIDGTTNTTASIPVAAGSEPVFMAVNPVTNKIYVSDVGPPLVIDGATNFITGIPGTSGLGDLAVNPITNKMYMVSGRNTVAVIDGATNSVVPVTTGAFAEVVAVNPATNKIYASFDGVTVIDGATNSTTTIAGGGYLAVNPVTNKLYNGGAVIDGATNSLALIPGGPFREQRSGQSNHERNLRRRR